MEGVLPVPRYRGTEILSLLKNHGQLSTSLISKMLEPEMKKRKLERALFRLQEKGFVERRKVQRGYTYYFLSQAPVNRSAVSHILNCRPDDLLQPLLRRRDWYHQELCEYWIFLFKQIYPEAEVVRDREVLSHEVASNILLADLRNSDLYPDFLLVFPEILDREQVVIAVDLAGLNRSRRYVSLGL